MIFNCGPTYEQKIKTKQRWHRWFAWHPIRVDEHNCAWLQNVMRIGTRGRRYSVHSYGPYEGWVNWSYKI